MTRLALILIALLGFTGPAQAALWFCQSGLELGPHEPTSAFGFRLTLEPQGAFHARGIHYVETEGVPFQWQGHYTRFDNQVAMIGPLTSGVQAAATETRAMSRRVREDVLILSMTGQTARSVMIRCLPYDLR